MARPQAGQAPSGLENLTNREREVLEMLAQGLKIGAIAGRLGTSARTIDCYLQQVYQKLQVPPGYNPRGYASRVWWERQVQLDRGNISPQRCAF